jgi:hypothetical protein
MFISITRWWLPFGALLLILGCATDGIDPQWQALLDKPGWVASESTKYQQHNYFLGHGVSANLDVAKKQSMDDVTEDYKKQLQSYVQKVVSDNSVSGASVSDDSSTDKAGRLLLTTQSQLYVEHIKQNRHITEIWQDPSSKAYHVLAVIDRVKIANELVGDINRFDQKVQRIMDRSEQEPDPLQRIAIANIAVDKFQQRQQLVAAVGFLNPASELTTSTWTGQRIQLQISRWLSDVKIMPVLKQQDPKLQDALAGGVTKAGFIVEYGAKPHYVLKAFFQQGQIKWNDGVYTLEGDLLLELWDGQTKGQVRGKTNWPILVSATERNRLPLEVAAAIEKANENKLRSAILEFEND